MYGTLPGYGVQVVAHRLSRIHECKTRCARDNVPPQDAGRMGADGVQSAPL
jgi:hypothetical protein